MLLKTCNRGLWEYNREGPHGAIILRYADCNLRCHVCYAQRYAYLNIYDKDVDSANIKQCIDGLRNLSEEAGWIRIQGGEPLMNDKRAFATAQMATESLTYLFKHSAYENPRVIIQTNGLWLSKTNLKLIRKFAENLKNGLSSVDRGRVVVEVSFKGPNLRDANLYALSKPSDVTSTVLPHQILGFKKLVKAITEEVWQDKLYRIAVYPVAGYGPEIDRPGFIPLSPVALTKKGEYPLFHPESWSGSFVKLLRSFRTSLQKWKAVYHDYLSKHEYKLPLEGMDPSKFQLGWISQIKKRPELERFLKKNMKADWTNRQLNFFRTKYPFLPEIIGQASDKLLDRVSDLKVDFYDSEPRFHYPYL